MTRASAELHLPIGMRRSPPAVDEDRHPGRAAPREPLADVIYVHEDPVGWGYWRGDLLAALSGWCRILWVTPTSLPAALRSAPRTPRALVQNLRGSLTKVAPRRWHLRVPVAVPRSVHPFAGGAADQLLARRIRSAAAALGFRRPVYWFEQPTYRGLMGLLGESATIYGATDEYTEYENITVAQAAALAAAEQEIAARADAILAIGDVLAKKFAIYGAASKVHLVRNGARPVVDPVAPYPALDGLRRPIVGTYGVLNRRIDWELLHDLASSRPAWSFVLAGPVRDAPLSPYLERLPNVHFLGWQAECQLMDCLRRFDVAIIPQVLSRLNRSGGLMKLYDFFTAGLPVVSSALPEAINYSPPVCVATGTAEFADAVEYAFANRERLAQESSALAAAHSWQSRARLVAALLLALPGVSTHRAMEGEPHS